MSGLKIAEIASNSNNLSLINKVKRVGICCPKMEEIKKVTLFSHFFSQATSISLDDIQEVEERPNNDGSALHGLELLGQVALHAFFRAANI